MFRKRMMVLFSVLLFGLVSTGQVFASSDGSPNVLRDINRQQGATSPWLWNTFLGGTSVYSSSILTDSNNNVFIMGSNGSPFVAKFNSNGAFQWQVNIGNGYGGHFTMDTSGNMYLIGRSAATWGTPVKPFLGSKYKVFVAKLNKDGVLQWNTFLGWDDDNGDGGITLDPNGGVIITGCFQSWVGLPPNYIDRRAFVSKLDSTSGVVQWNSLLGNALGQHCGADVAVDSTGNILVTGASSHSWGLPVAPFTGYWDIFVAKLTNNGNLLWNTFLGSAAEDGGSGIAVDKGDNAFITGMSRATWGSPVNPFTGEINNGFVVKINKNGAKQWNTFINGDGSAEYDIALDENGSVYVLGGSDHTWGSPLHNYVGGGDAFIANINPGTGNLIWNTFEGGTCTDRGYAITLGMDGNIYTTGYSCDTWGSPINAYGGNSGDAFIAKQARPVALSKTSSSVAAQDGWLLESTETSNIGGAINTSLTTFALGDSAAKQQYRGLLSFSTGGLPDTAVISGVTLKVKKNGFIGGGDPVATFQGFMIDIKTGFFGTFPALQATDFQDPASKTLGPATPALINNWYSINLINGKDYINKLTTNSGLTQIRLRFKLDDNNDAVANYLSLFSGDAATAADHPQLVVTYYVP